MVNGAPLTVLELSQELRAMLWVRGESWKGLDEEVRGTRRQEALDRCIERWLMREFAKTDEPLSAEQVKESEDAFQQFLKQFESPQGWEPRLKMQGLSEVQMRERITGEILRDSALERWLETQRDKDAKGAENAARAWYEQNAKSLTISERARVSHLFLTAHDKNKPDRAAEITELHRQLAAGEATLATLATKFSDDERSKKAGGNLGWIERDRMPADLAKELFALPLKKTSAPFRTSLGWHIAIVHERQAARVPAFTEVQPEIMARLDQAWRESAVRRLVAELREKAKINVEQEALRRVEPAP